MRLRRWSPIALLAFCMKLAALPFMDAGTDAAPVASPAPAPVESSAPTPVQSPGPAPAESPAPVEGPAPAPVVASPTSAPTATSAPQPTVDSSSPSVVCEATGATSSARHSVNGATADDDSDDTEAIQRAIDEAGAEGGGVVSLPAGTFVLNGHLVLHDGVELSGAGPQTVLKAGPEFLETPGNAGGFPVVSTDGASDVTIANLTADQSGDTLDGNVDGRLTQYVIDVRNSENVVVDGVFVRNPFTYSIAVVASSRFCVTNSDTLVTSIGRYDQLDGIHVLDSSHGQVINNHVDQGAADDGDGDDGLVAHTMGGDVHDVLYANNDVRGGRHGAGMQFAFTGHAIYDITVRGNRFYGRSTAIHNGVYDGQSGTTRDVEVTGNHFDDGTTTAVEFQGDVQRLRVTDNRTCGAEVNIPAGNGNVSQGNVDDC